jgi:lysophospholipase L1-like esterase
MNIDSRQVTIQAIAPTNTAVTTGDTLESAMGKVQGQISANTTAIAAKATNLTTTAIKTSAYTAAANELVTTDATSGSVPVTLPAAPADKTRIAVKMIAVSGSNTTTITTSSTDVFNKAGGATSASLFLLNQAVTFQYEAATGIWSAVSSDLPLSQLDLRFATLAQQTTNTANITSINTRLQTETQDYLARVIAAGGKVDAAALQAIDKFIVRGKFATWFSLLKQAWIPVGDYAASQLFLVTPTGITPTFTNFVAADYVPNLGYYLATNTNKWIDTGLTPDNNGMGTKNVMLALAASKTVNSGNFIICHNHTNSVNSPLVAAIGSATNPGIGTIGISQNVKFADTEPFVAAGSFHASGYYGVVNKELCFTASTTLTDVLANPIFLFKSRNFSDAISYTPGNIGAYFIGSSMTSAQLTDFGTAVEELMIGLRRLYFVDDRATFVGDSITAGYRLSTPTQIAFADTVSQRLGFQRPRNIGINSARVNAANNGVLALTNRYQSTIDNTSGVIFGMLGSNDMAADVTANGDGTIITPYQTNLSTAMAAYAAARRRVIWASSPPHTGKSDTMNAAYAAAAAAAAKANKIPFADMWRAFNDTGNVASLMVDTQHPNQAGHTLMTEYWVEAYYGRLLRKPTLDFPSIAAQSSADLTVTVLNAEVGMQVTLGLPAALEAGLVANAFVSAADTVTVRLTNITTAAIDPASAQYKVTVFTNY